MSDGNKKKVDENRKKGRCEQKSNSEWGFKKYKKNRLLEN